MAQHTASLWHDVVKAVISLMRSTPGYRDPNVDAATGVPVFHSLEVALHEEELDLLLVVGYIGNPDEPAESGDLGQAWGTLGTRGRNEEGRVRCALVAQSGDLSAAAAVPALFDALFTALDDVGAALRANPTLSLNTAYTVAELGAVSSIRVDPGRGGEVTAEFLITYKTRT